MEEFINGTCFIFSMDATEYTRLINKIVIIVCFFYIRLCLNDNLKKPTADAFGQNSISGFFAECNICVSLKDRMIKWLPRENISSQKVLNQKTSVEHKKDGPNPSFDPYFCAHKKLCTRCTYILT